MNAVDLDHAQWFAGVARDLVAREGVKETLDEICRLARDGIEGCQSAGVSLVHRGGRVDTPASTDETVTRIHSAQYGLGQGPCLDAIRESEIVQIDDMTDESRWPRFAAMAAASGIRSMLCFRLFTHENRLGALNLFSDTAFAFGEHARSSGLIFAAHAAVGLSTALNEANLSAAIATRQRIGEAVGIIAERHGMNTQDAFALLARSSQNHNVPLRELAERLVTAEDASREPRVGPAQ